MVVATADIGGVAMNMATPYTVYHLLFFCRGCLSLYLLHIW